MSKGFAVARLGEVEPLHQNKWVSWWPVRHQLDIQAFGANVWVARREGDEVIGDHDESDERHEELYVVIRGHASFTVGEEKSTPRQERLSSFGRARGESP